MMGFFYHAILLLFLIAAGCSGPIVLSDQDREKLDPSLQQVLDGIQSAERKMNISVNNDGTKLYGVIIRIKDNVTEKDLGIHCNTIHQGIATAKLTLEEIKRIVQLDAVIRVETGTKSYINQ